MVKSKCGMCATVQVNVMHDGRKLFSSCSRETLYYQRWGRGRQALGTWHQCLQSNNDNYFLKFGIELHGKKNIKYCFS